MRIYILILLAFSFGGCMTTQKAKSFLEKKNELAPICAEEFPVKEKIVKGDSVITFDTLYLETEGRSDTVETKDTVRITKTLPPKVITRTVRIVDTVYQENTARVEDQAHKIDMCAKAVMECQDRLEQSNDNTASWKQKARKRQWLLLLAIGVFAGWTFRKQIPKLIKSFV